MKENFPYIFLFLFCLFVCFLIHLFGPVETIMFCSYDDIILKKKKGK